MAATAPGETTRTIPRHECEGPGAMVLCGDGMGEQEVAQRKKGALSQLLEQNLLQSRGSRVRIS